MTRKREMSKKWRIISKKCFQEKLSFFRGSLQTLDLQTIKLQWFSKFPIPKIRGAKLTILSSKHIWNIWFKNSHFPKQIYLKLHWFCNLIDLSFILNHSNLFALHIHKIMKMMCPPKKPAGNSGRFFPPNIQRIPSFPKSNPDKVWRVWLGNWKISTEVSWLISQLKI